MKAILILLPHALDERVKSIFHNLTNGLAWNSGCIKLWIQWSIICVAPAYTTVDSSEVYNVVIDLIVIVYVICSHDYRWDNDTENWNEKENLKEKKKN